MNKPVTIIISSFFIVLLLMFFFAAISGSPAEFSEIFVEQFTGFLDWYSIDGYYVHESGAEVPILNSEYETSRKFVDFIFVFLILWGIFWNNGGLKDRFGKQVLLFTALMISGIFVSTSGFGLAQLGLFPIINYGPFIALSLGPWLAWLLFLGGRKTKPLTKAIIGILCIGIAFVVLHYGTEWMPDTSDLKNSIKLPSWPGAKPQGIIEPDYASRILPEGGIAKSNKEKAEELYAQAEEHYKNAEKYFNDGNKKKASDEIKKAEAKNKKALGLLSI